MQPMQNGYNNQEQMRFSNVMAEVRRQELRPGSNSFGRRLALCPHQGTNNPDNPGSGDERLRRVGVKP